MLGHGQEVETLNTIIEYFDGDGSDGQSFQLSGIPLLPIAIMVYDSNKNTTLPLDSDNYSVSTVTPATVTLNADVSVSSGTDNVKIAYVPKNSATSGSIESSLESTETITLAGADPSESINLDYASATGRGDIRRIIVAKTADAGTAYDANSRTVEIFDVGTATGPTSQRENTLFYEDGLEPTGTGRLINRTTVTLGLIQVVNTGSNPGRVSVTIAASGGDATSEEEYTIKIQGVEQE